MCDILIADDSYIIRRTLENILVHAGHTVYQSENGLEMLEVYTNTSPDVVLLGIDMPVMSGLEALLHLRDIDPDAKVIICSSHDDEYTLNKAKSLGVEHFISKPFSANDVRAVIEQYV